jgi:hypothetical protein
MVTESSRMELEDTRRMEESKNIHTIIVWENKGQRLLDKTRFRLKYNIEVDL